MTHSVHPDDIFRQFGNQKAANAFAGQASEWHSANGMPQSITYKLKEKAVVRKITFRPRADNKDGNTPRDCPKNFRIEGSHDGSSFVVIKRVERKKKRSKMVYNWLMS